MSTTTTQNVTDPNQDFEKASKKAVAPDPNIDYLSEAKKLDASDVKGRAKLVLDAALHNSTSTVYQYACQEVYDQCKKGSEEIGLVGTWTINKSNSSRQSVWICSGGILVDTTNNLRTSGGLEITASFVAGTPPTGPQKAI